MPKLTDARIEALSNKRGAKKIAVQNFLWTVGNNECREYAYANLEQDARLYKWNAATQAAIRTGISEHFK